jgi:hypothetical protein
MMAGERPWVSPLHPLSHHALRPTYLQRSSTNALHKSAHLPRKILCTKVHTFPGNALHKSTHLPGGYYTKIISFLIYSVFSNKTYTAIDVFSSKTQLNQDDHVQKIAIDNTNFLALSCIAYVYDL